MKRTTFLLAAAFSAVATPALAHPGHLHVSDLTAGLLHPFMGLDHLLVMFAVGLLAVQKGGKATIALPALFIGMLVVGALAGMSSLAIPFVEQGILSSVIILGAVIATGRRLPVSAASALVAGFALFHGAAHGIEIPVGADAMNYVVGFAAATLVLHALGFGLGKIVPALVSEKIAARAFQIAGAGMALVGFGLAAA